MVDIRGRFKMRNDFYIWKKKCNCSGDTLLYIAHKHLNVVIFHRLILF